MSLLGSIAAPLIGGAFGLLGADMQNSATSAMMSKQFEYNKEIMQNKHQWEVSDLKRAGLNPMLSAMNGATGTLGVSSAQGANPHLAESITGFSASQLQAKQRELIDTQLGNAKSEVELNNANALKARAEAQATSDMVDIQRNNSASSTAVNDSMIALNNTINRLHEIDVKYADLFKKEGLKKAQIDNVYIIDMYEAQLKSMEIGNQTSLMNASANQLNAQSNMIKANVAKELGVSQSQVNYALAHKHSAETQKTAHEMESIIMKNKSYEFENDLKLNHPRTIQNLQRGSEIAENIPLLGNVLKFMR